MALAGVFGLALTTPLVGRLPGADAASGCRGGNPLANVWSPSRLKVLSNCKTVSGTIAHLDIQPDGDRHFYMKVDHQYASMLNKTNKATYGGTLILEIVPADQSGCIKGRRVKDGICTGANVWSPHQGQHVTVTGPWVWDSLHGWNEIHPVWSIR
jgi:hypothetical protein